jgi:cytochrome c5
MKRGLLLGLALTFAFTGISIAASPAQDGASLLEQRCSVCHPSARPKAAKKTPAEWESTVSRMIGKGAKINADEKKILVEHLGKTYKP